MGKKLITVGNYSEHICGDKFYVTSDMIITPGAKDKIKSAGVELVYGNKCTTKECSVTTTQNNNLDERLIEILVKDFGITDAELIKRILTRVKEII